MALGQGSEIGESAVEPNNYYQGRMSEHVRRSRKWLSKQMLVIFTGLIGLTGHSCSNGPYDGKIVAVQLASGNEGSVEGASLVLVDPDAPNKPVEILSKGFSGACTPSLSHDGRYLYFQGKKQQTDPWQIWMMDLHRKSFSQVTDLPENCTHPTALPDETVIFSRESSVKGIRVDDLWRCGMDGCCLTRITFTPASNNYSSILSEGRVLYLSSQQYPEPNDPVLMVMLPDGTKSELYSPGCSGLSPVTGGAESNDGYIYFVSAGGRLSRVLHRRPLHTFEDLSGEIAGTFSTVTPLEDGTCLVAYRPSSASPMGIYSFDPAGNTAPALIYQGVGDLTDPVKIAAMATRPRILPSAVNPENPTALLMSQDINHSILPVHPGIAGDTMAHSIRVISLEGEQAEVEVREDGSFYLKMAADLPFRIETLNSLGETVRGPSDWIYLRPNERRACIGCHADPELAPENIQPAAVKTDPVVLFAKLKENSN
jgi:hypothetical protein